MSGGIAMWDVNGDFAARKGMVDLDPVEDDQDVFELRELIEQHRDFTGSTAPASSMRGPTCAVREGDADGLQARAERASQARRGDGSLHPRETDRRLCVGRDSRS